VTKFQGLPGAEFRALPDDRFTARTYLARQMKRTDVGKMKETVRLIATLALVSTLTFGAVVLAGSTLAHVGPSLAASTPHPTPDPHPSSRMER